ncbi:MAG: DUF4352 domain-containing protein [Bacteroidales bacterium]
MKKDKLILTTFILICYLLSSCNSNIEEYKGEAIGFSYEEGADSITIHGAHIVNKRDGNYIYVNFTLKNAGKIKRTYNKTDFVIGDCEGVIFEPEFEKKSKSNYTIKPRSPKTWTLIYSEIPDSKRSDYTFGYFTGEKMKYGIKLQDYVNNHFYQEIDKLTKNLLNKKLYITTIPRLLRKHQFNYINVYSDDYYKFYKRNRSYLGEGIQFEENAEDFITNVTYMQMCDYSKKDNNKFNDMISFRKGYEKHLINTKFSLENKSGTNSNYLAEYINKKTEIKCTIKMFEYDEMLTLKIDYKNE